MSSNPITKDRTSELIRRFNFLSVPKDVSPAKSDFPKQNQPENASEKSTLPLRGQLPGSGNSTQFLQDPDIKQEPLNLDPLEFFKENNKALSEIIKAEPNQIPSTETPEKDELAKPLQPRHISLFKNRFPSISKIKNHSVGHSQNTNSGDSPPKAQIEDKKSLSIKQKILSRLNKFATIDPKTTAATKSWMVTAAQSFDLAEKLALENKYEDAYVQYLKSCEIIVKIIPNQPDFDNYKASPEYNALKKKADKALKAASDLLNKLTSLQASADQQPENDKMTSDDLINDFRNRYPSIPTNLSNLPNKETHKNLEINSSNVLVNTSPKSSSNTLLSDKDLDDRIINFRDRFPSINTNLSEFGLNKNNTPVNMIPNHLSSNLAKDQNQKELSQLEIRNTAPFDLFQLIRDSEPLVLCPFILFDVRSQAKYNDCHINYINTINLDPNQIDSSTILNYLFQKIAKSSSIHSELLATISKFKAFVYLDDSNFPTLDPSKTKVSELKFFTFCSLLNDYLVIYSDAPSRKPILKISGDVYNYLLSKNASFLGGKIRSTPGVNAGIQEYKFGQVAGESPQTSQTASENVEGSLSLSPKSFKPHIINKRGATLFSPSAAEIIAKTVENENLSNLEYISNRIDYENFVNNQNSPLSGTSSTVIRNSNSPQNNLYLNPVSQPTNIEYSTASQKQPELLSKPNVLDTPVGNSSNTDLYHVITKKSKSIQKALKNNQPIDENYPVSSILHRKTVFDNFLMGFTHSNSELKSGSTNFSSNIKNHTTSPGYKDNIAQNISDNIYFSSAENKNSPSSSRIHGPRSTPPPIPKKPLGLKNDPANTKISDSKKPELGNIAKDDYLNRPNESKLQEQRLGAQAAPSYRSISSGPQSKPFEATVNSAFSTSQMSEFVNSTAASNQNSLLSASYPNPLYSKDRHQDTLNPNSINSSLSRSPSPLLFESTTAIAHIGLKNLGNTCYINSVIQCLSGTVPFSRFFLSGMWKQAAAVNRNFNGYAIKKMGNRSTTLVALTPQSENSIQERQKLESLTVEFSRLVEQLWNDNSTSISPLPFVKSVRNYFITFDDNDQHDSQEFVSFFLSSIHDILNVSHVKRPQLPSTKALTKYEKDLLSKKEFQEEAKFEMLNDFEQSRIKWLDYIRFNQSIVVSLFQGQLQSRLVCSHCSHKSTNYSVFNELSVPIPIPKNKHHKHPHFRLPGTHASSSIPSAMRKFSKHTVDISDCLSKFVESEILDSDNEWLCPNCKKRDSATKTLRISKLPLVLMIHLKRFSYEGLFRDKLETMVTYPLDNLDMSPYLTSNPLCGDSLECDENSIENTPSDNLYSLYAVVNHMGSLSGGHYTASVYNGLRKEWSYFNDTRISRIKPSDVISPAAYLLFFVRNQKEISLLPTYGSHL
ncbi:hypothetical protein BB560_002939 [Smittium megazygosporum]|uniref:ubiquitinyl hydrolase 1 n=1 Tax=Smittium megazygosporum TaxID=133381 RepID=A0A2T9ZDJ1_9FUNG|nr:hypothetical protein BB560_002939 [Smittium megazygosporum]